MKVSERIAMLVEEADALRPLHEDDVKKLPLAGIIDEINRLRALQASEGFEDAETLAALDERFITSKEGALPTPGITMPLGAISASRTRAEAVEAALKAENAELAAKRRGRKPKATIEGADAA